MQASCLMTLVLNLPKEQNFQLCCRAVPAAIASQRQDRQLAVKRERSREKARSKLTQRRAAKRRCDCSLRVHRALQLRPNDPLQLFFSSLTLAKQPRTIGRPVQRQPTGSVQCLISLYCTLLPHYAGKIELPACATYTAWITGATLRRRDAAVR